jgi:hypothetical protein
MVDTSHDGLRPDSVWRALGRSLAAGTGALTALVSLLTGATLTTACTRGGVTLIGLLLLTRIGVAALAAAQAAEERAFDGPEPSEPAD